MFQKEQLAFLLDAENIKRCKSCPWNCGFDAPIWNGGFKNACGERECWVAVYQELMKGEQK